MHEKSVLDARRMRKIVCVLLVGCASQSAPPPAPTATIAPFATPAPIATSKPPPKIDTAAWTGKDRPKTWTDPRAIAALAIDCDFVPPKVEPEDSMDIPADPIVCQLAYSQSCTPDFCNIYTDECEKKCATGCSDCGTTCSKSCKTCKASCTDDACKAKCAETCGTCKESCSRTFDRCATGNCGKEASTCNANLKKLWKTQGCKTKCASFETCRGNCGNKDFDACTVACGKKAFGTGYDTCASKCGEEDWVCRTNCMQTAGCSDRICMMPPE